MEKPIVFALHGFLGHSSDWNELKNKLPQYEWITPSYFHTDFNHWTDFETLIEELRRYLNQNKKYIFIGYSLGGRLGLHFFKKYPQYFSQMIFLSTHYGLENQDLKNNRFENDLKWKNTLANSEWEIFLDLWNQQPVFSGSTPMIRPIEDYNLDLLKNGLTGLSLGRQISFKSDLENSKMKMNWVTGEFDQKFTELSHQLGENLFLHKHQIKKGHRLLEGDLSQLIDLLKKII